MQKEDQAEQMSSKKSSQSSLARDANKGKRSPTRTTRRETVAIAEKASDAPMGLRKELISANCGKDTGNDNHIEVGGLSHIQSIYEQRGQPPANNEHLKGLTQHQSESSEGSPKNNLKAEFANFKGKQLDEDLDSQMLHVQHHNFSANDKALQRSNSYIDKQSMSFGGVAPSQNQSSHLYSRGTLDNRMESHGIGR